ncbi:MAG: DUF362 domain-containing protein [Ferruginibacter sp.]
MTNRLQPFLNIQTVFNKENERTVEILKTVYNDHAYLLSVIESVSGESLTKEAISGKKVLLKPNWVKHSYQSTDEICLRTHDNFLVAVLESVLSKGPSEVTIGDAPIQGCNWDKMIQPGLLKKIEALSAAYTIPVTIKDFRRTLYNTIANTLETTRRPLSEYIIFDTGTQSYLEPITTTEKNLFRVSQYNPDKFTQTHRPGVHKYCIAKELFSADIVISLPKIKTHEKTGITCALKNIVGLNGDKDFLPHHRIGGTDKGGDSYPGNNRLRYLSELAHDNANRRIGKPGYRFWKRVASLLWRFSFPKNDHRLNGAWHGNDTTWRMVMDLNMIINYGKADGTLSAELQRPLYSFCDGIIAGQGNGPLRPDPLSLGIICFSNSAALTDTCMAILIGLKTEKLPLLMAARSFITDHEKIIRLNGNPVTEDDLKTYGVVAALPPGWVNYEKAS